MSISALPARYITVLEANIGLCGSISRYIQLGTIKKAQADDIVMLFVFVSRHRMALADSFELHPNAIHPLTVAT